MLDIYQSRRKPQYELVVPHGTNIASYDQWNGDWQFIKTTGNPGKNELDSVGKNGHYLGRRDGFFLEELNSLDNN